MVFTSRKKTTPRPSPFEYHWRILPSRYNFTVARISVGMIFMICSRFTPCLPVIITITSVVLGDGMLEGVAGVAVMTHSPFLNRIWFLAALDGYVFARSQRAPIL